MAIRQQADVALVSAPEQGIWRLGKAEEPTKHSKITKADSARSGGNRWSIVDCGILYCATDLDGCFAEALAPFRVDPEMRAVIGDSWNDPYYLNPGTLPQDWRTRHMLVRLQPTKGAQFLDVDDERTLHTLTHELGTRLFRFGVEKLTAEHIQGPDRRITRQISAWAAGQRTPWQERLIHGIAYRSRFGMRQCWAVFDEVHLDLVERRPIWPETEGLSAVAAEYALTIR